MGIPQDLRGAPPDRLPLWHDLWCVGVALVLIALGQYAHRTGPLTVQEVLSYCIVMPLPFGLFWGVTRQRWLRRWVQPADLPFTPHRVFLLMLTSAALLAVGALLWL